MAWPDEIDAVAAAPSGNLGTTTPTHRQSHDQYRTALIAVKDKVNTLSGGTVQPLEYAISPEDVDVTTGTSKLTVRAPYALTLTEVRLSASVASSSGTPTVDMNVSGSSVLSTKLTLDVSEKTSETAATAAVISASYVADDAEITFDIDTAGTGVRGLKVKLYHTVGGTPPAANITFVAEAHTTYAGGRTTTTVTKPTGTADNDYILLGILTALGGEAPNPTPPAGFTLVDSFLTDVDGGGFNVEMRIYGKVATSEGASWDFTHSSASSQGFALTYRGVHTGTPLDATTTTNTGTGTTTTATGITTVTNGAMVVLVAHDFGDTTNNLTAPTGTTPTFTERIDTALIYVADGVMTTAGATGNKTMTNNSNSFDPWAAALIALRPA